ncbi:MAG TPA: hypothetical protein VNC22_02725, partial [Sporichthya sp.]|nr:hypothetical protein [Sporichthya sp.]
RRAQRHYIEEWVAVVGPLRPDLTDAEVRLTVHAAIGAIQSILFHNLGVPTDRLVELLDQAAHACLGVPPAPGDPLWPLGLSGVEPAASAALSDSLIT